MPKLKYITLGILITTCTWFTIYLLTPRYVQPNTEAKVASPEIKRAMHKMGPMKNYRILPNGKLQVMVENQWLNLRY